MRRQPKTLNANSLQDRIPQPRGFAIKLFGVNGPRFPEGEGLTTHDIEFNSTAALDLADAKTTKEIVDLRMKHGNNQPELYRHLECRHDTELQKGRDRIHNTHLESTRQYSQTPYRFGDYVIKYCLVPTGETQKKLYNETIKPEDGDDILHRWLQSFHKDHDAEYEFQVQLLENLEDQPVEYAGKAWDAEKYPWQTVAKLVIPRQESFDYDRKTFWEDHMRVNPWMGLASLQPLGSSNRLRRVGMYNLGFNDTLWLLTLSALVYPASSALRRKMNGRKAVDISSIDELPN